MSEASAAIVRQFWARMQSNDFGTLRPILTDDFRLEWPQSNELIRGAENFIRMNAEYPAAGPWRFSVLRVVGGDSEAVSEVIVTDGGQTGRAISFFSLAGGRISRLVEYWPEPYPAPENRRHLAEPLNADWTGG